MLKSEPRLRITGHIADAETGLSYMQARYYDPYAGRFLAVDPLDATPVAFNRYWYANTNNPYKYFDRDGRDAGSLYTGKKYQMAQPVCQSACAVAIGLVIDFTPVVSDIKGIAEAIKEPTLVNVAAAAVGLLGPVGDEVGRTLKNGAKLAENAK